MSCLDSASVQGRFLSPAACMLTPCRHSRVFAKPFISAFVHDDGVTCLARNPKLLNSLVRLLHAAYLVMLSEGMCSVSTTCVTSPGMCRPQVAQMESSGYGMCQGSDACAGWSGTQVMDGLLLFYASTQQAWETGEAMRKTAL